MKTTLIVLSAVFVIGISIMVFSASSSHTVEDAASLLTPLFDPCSGYCEARINITNPTTYNITITNFTTYATYANGSPAPVHISLGFVVPNTCTNTTLGNGTIITSCTGEQTSLTAVPGVNILKVWSHDKPGNENIEWNFIASVYGTNGNKEINETFDTYRKGWAMWANSTVMAVPVYEFENATQQNRSYWDIVNATLNISLANTTGIVGSSAVKCDGRNASCGFHISNNGALNPTTKQSIGLWFKIPNGRGSFYFFRKGTTLQYYSFVNANNTFEFVWNTGNTTQSNGVTNVSDNKEHCLVLNYNGSQQWGVLDNVTEPGTNKTRGATITVNTNAVTFFSDKGGNPMNGTIDEVFFKNDTMEGSDLTDFCSKIPASGSPSVDTCTLACSSTTTANLNCAILTFTGSGTYTIKHLVSAGNIIRPSNNVCNLSIANGPGRLTIGDST